MADIAIVTLSSDAPQTPQHETCVFIFVSFVSQTLGRKRSKAAPKVSLSRRPGQDSFGLFGGAALGLLLRQRLLERRLLRRQGPHHEVLQGERPSAAPRCPYLAWLRLGWELAGGWLGVG